MIYQIIIIFIITAIKGIFSAADTAFTYLNKAEIMQLSKKDTKANKIKILMENTNKFFGIIEVGLNMSELIASAYASMTIVEILIDCFKKMNFSTNVAVVLSVAIITIILSYILLVFGSVIPRKIARNNPKKVIYSIIPILWIIAKLNYPFERLIYFSNKFFSCVFHIKEEPQEKMTEKQLKMIIQEAREEGVVANIEKRIMNNVLKVNDISVEKIMVSIEKVDCINLESSMEEIIANIRKNQYTRMPVYKQDKNKIIGIFNIKDVTIKYLTEGIQTKEEIEKVIRKPKFLNKEEKIFNAFRKLQENHQVIGIVVDEENKPIGIISIEDILEKLVGKIFDEYDKVI